MKTSSTGAVLTTHTTGRCWCPTRSTKSTTQRMNPASRCQAEAGAGAAGVGAAWRQLALMMPEVAMQSMLRLYHSHASSCPTQGPTPAPQQPHTLGRHRAQVPPTVRTPLRPTRQAQERAPQAVHTPSRRSSFCAPQPWPTCQAETAPTSTGRRLASLLAAAVGTGRGGPHQHGQRTATVAAAMYLATSMACSHPTSVGTQEMAQQAPAGPALRGVLQLPATVAAVAAARSLIPSTAAGRVWGPICGGPAAPPSWRSTGACSPAASRSAASGRPFRPLWASGMRGSRGGSSSSTTTITKSSSSGSREVQSSSQTTLLRLTEAANMRTAPPPLQQQRCSHLQPPASMTPRAPMHQRHRTDMEGAAAGACGVGRRHLRRRGVGERAGAVVAAGVLHSYPQALTAGPLQASIRLLSLSRARVPAWSM